MNSATPRWPLPQPRAGKAPSRPLGQEARGAHRVSGAADSSSIGRVTCGLYFLRASFFLRLNPSCVKKGLLITAGVLAVAAFASAAQVTVQCTPDPQNFPGGIGSTFVTCPSFASLGLGPGFLWNSTALIYTGDYILDSAFHNGHPDANTVTITFTPAPAPGFTGAVVIISNAANSFAKANNSPVFDPANPNTNPAASLSFVVSEASTTAPNTGGVSVSNASVTETFTYSPNTPPPPGTPEPTTMCIVGLSMLGLGLPRLRRKLTK
jgi:hypothetical protein